MVDRRAAAGGSYGCGRRLPRLGFCCSCSARGRTPGTAKEPARVFRAIAACAAIAAASMGGSVRSAARIAAANVVEDDVASTGVELVVEPPAREDRRFQPVILGAAGTVLITSSGVAMAAMAVARKDIAGDNDVINTAEWARRILDEGWHRRRRRSSGVDDTSSTSVGGADMSSSRHFLLPASNDIEEAMVAALEGEDGTLLADAVRRLGPDDARARTQFAAFGSAQISHIVDRVARNISSDDFSALASLNVLAAVLSRLSDLADSVFESPPRFAYCGSRLKTASVEALYRRYVVFCLSTQQRLAEDVLSLEVFRSFLGIREERAREIGLETGKAVFQVAISSVIYRGCLTDADKAELGRLKRSFAGVIDEQVADTIVSEVGVMRVLGELQKLLQERDASQQKLRELRRMSEDLDVNMDDVLESIDDLALALGSEAREYVGSLKMLLLADDAGAEARP